MIEEDLKTYIDAQWTGTTTKTSYVYHKNAPHNAAPYNNTTHVTIILTDSRGLIKESWKGADYWLYEGTIDITGSDYDKVEAAWNEIRRITNVKTAAGVDRFIVSYPTLVSDYLSNKFTATCHYEYYTVVLRNVV